MKPKKLFKKLIIVGMVVLNVLFAIAVIIVTAYGNTVPDALIYCWFAFTAGELGISGWHELLRIKKNDSNNDGGTV